MANYYLSNTAWALVTQWAASTSISLGAYRRQLAAPATGSERVFVCITAGTTGGTEPTWVLTNNATTNDGSVVWRQIAGQEAHQISGWTAPLASLGAVLTLLAAGPGDNIYISSDHAISLATAVTVNTNSASLISVDRTGAVPPTAANYLRGAKFTGTGALALTIQKIRAFGIDFVSGNGTTSASTIVFAGDSTLTYLEDCLLHINTTSASGLINLTSTLTSGVEWGPNTSVRFNGAAAQGIYVGNNSLYWHDNTNSTAVQCPGTQPASLFLGTTGQSRAMSQIKNVNLTGFAGTQYVASSNGRGFKIESCLLNDTPAYTAAIGTFTTYGSGPSTIFSNCAKASALTNAAITTSDMSGEIRKETAVIRTGGANDGFNDYSLRAFIAVASTSENMPVKLPVIRKWNSTVGSITVTLHGIHLSATAVGKRDFYAELNYPDQSPGPLLKFMTDKVSDIDTTAALVTDSASIWNSLTSARANSTVYAQGAFVKVASNPDRLFMAATAGTSTGSEPAGFATAVDGTAITDGTVTWTTGRRFKHEFSFTTTRKGMIEVTPNYRRTVGTFTALMLDPKLDVT